MTRDDLLNFIQKDNEWLYKKIVEKNKEYGNPDDAYFNFRETARRMFGPEPSVEDMFHVLMILADKHWVALAQKLTQTPDCLDKLEDIEIYCKIARAMIHRDPVVRIMNEATKVGVFEESN
jgi:hypothetical protein